MGKDCEGGEKPANGGRRWSEGRKKYVCVDEAGVEVVSKVIRID